MLRYGDLVIGYLAVILLFSVPRWYRAELGQLNMLHRSFIHFHNIPTPHATSPRRPVEYLIPC